MVLGFALNLGAFTSSVTLHSSFFSSSMDSSFFAYSVDSAFLHISIYSFFIPSVDSFLMSLYSFIIYFAINQVLGSVLNLGLFASDYYYSSSFFITSTKLLLSSFKAVYNLHNFIRPFILYPVSLYVIFMYPYTQQNTIIFYRRFKSMPPISFPLFIYSHLYSSLQSSILPT